MSNWNSCFLVATAQKHAMSRLWYTNGRRVICLYIYAWLSPMLTCTWNSICIFSKKTHFVFYWLPNDDQANSWSPVSFGCWDYKLQKHHKRLSNVYKFRWFFRPNYEEAAAAQRGSGGRAWLKYCKSSVTMIEKRRQNCVLKWNVWRLCSLHTRSRGD